MSATIISQEEIATLQALKGATLKAYSGYRLFENSSTFYGRVRLEIDDKQVDIANRLRNLTFGEDAVPEEVGILSIEPADEAIWLPNKEKIYREKCTGTIEALFVAEDTIRFMNGNSEMCTKKFSQAIVL